jgi:hypothetical protein
MIETAGEMPDPRAKIPGALLIREGAFVKAKQMCPLWPFC